MLKTLINKFFGVHPRDIRSIQNHDNYLLEIIENVKSGKNENFAFINGILYKKGSVPDTYLLCLPGSVATPAIFRLHFLYNFHFSFELMMGKIIKLIFCPNLENIILDVIKTCPICTLSPDKNFSGNVGVRDLLCIDLCNAS